MSDAFDFDFGFFARIRNAIAQSTTKSKAVGQKASDPHGQKCYLAFTLIQIGEPTKPNSLRIWFSRKR